MIMSNQQKWIKSRGGPLVCMDAVLAHHWLGVVGNSVAQGPESNCINDYERACSISDYLGKIVLNNRQALVLGDLPLETTVWQLPAQLPRIVRVYYADPGVDVIKMLECKQDLDFSNPVESMGVDVQSGSMTVFEAACAWKDIGDAHITFDLSPGSYLIVTKNFQPDDRTSVLVHKFEWVQ